MQADMRGKELPPETQPKTRGVSKTGRAPKPEEAQKARKAPKIGDALKTGGAPVVLLHGFAQTPRSWDGVAAALHQEGSRTFAPNLLEWSGDSLEQLCDHVANVVRNVAAAEGRPVLVGYSMGGRIAAEAVVRRSDLPLGGLVLESAGLGPADEEARAALVERNAQWAARLRERGVGAFMDWWETLPLFATQRALPAAVRAALRAERTAGDPEALACALEAWGAHRQAAEPDTLAALAALVDRGVLVRYLAGALDGKYVGIAARVRAAGIPVTLVPCAGHNVHLERPAAFSEIMTQCLSLL